MSKSEPSFWGKKENHLLRKITAVILIYKVKDTDKLIQTDIKMYELCRKFHETIWFIIRAITWKLYVWTFQSNHWPTSNRLMDTSRRVSRISMTCCPLEWILHDVETAGKPSLNICIKHMHTQTRHYNWHYTGKCTLVSCNCNLPPPNYLKPLHSLRMGHNCLDSV